MPRICWCHESLIDEKRAADESMSTYVTDDEELGDWLAAASSVSKGPAKKTSAFHYLLTDSSVADALGPLGSTHENILIELKQASSVIPWLCVLARKLLAVPTLLLRLSSCFLQLEISCPKSGPV